VRKEDWGVALITIKVVRPSLRPGLRPREILVHLDQGEIDLGLNCPIEVTVGLNQDRTFWQ